MSTLDCQFFTETLRRFEKNSTISVHSIVKNAACDTGNNFVADVNRVILKGVKNGQAFQWSLITKELPQDMPFNPELVFKNEMYAYKHIIPTLNDCLENPLPFPKCLVATDNLIILEDLSVEGFGNADKFEGLSYEQIKSAIKVLAQLHSASIILQHKNPTKFQEISTKVVELVYTPQATPMIETQEFSLQYAIELLRQNNRKEDHQMIKIIENLKGRTFRMLRHLLLKPREISVINHGDPWINNVLVRNSEVNLIDFQMMRTTSVAADLSYFLFINMNPRDRMTKESALLDIYLNEINLSLVKANVNTQLTRNWLENEMSDFKLFGYIYGMWLLPIFTETTYSGINYQTLDKISKKRQERILEFTRDYCYSQLNRESLVKNLQSFNINEKEIL